MFVKTSSQPTLNRKNAEQVGFSAFPNVSPSALGELTANDGIKPTNER